MARPPVKKDVKKRKPATPKAAKGAEGPGTEIVIGLVGALGVDMDKLQSHVESALTAVNYSPIQVHLSKLPSELGGIMKFPDVESPLYGKRVLALMERGNYLRAKLGGSAMAKLAMMKIKDERQKKTGSDIKPAARTAYILRSLKHPDEVAFLRETYGTSFFLFAAYSPRDARVAATAQRIADDEARHRADEFKAEAEKLVAKDEEESDNALGQQVRKTFWRGDAYVDGSDMSKVKDDVERIINLWFESPFITPTRDEYAMFGARAAAYRSAAMGRQVGAVIATEDGSIVSTGCNEIPKSGGGEYWENDNPDHRDHSLGYDSSDRMRMRLMQDALDKLMKLGWKPPGGTKKPGTAKQILRDPAMANAEVHALIEYQRAVHAEMSSLMDATRRGVAVQGCTLYCTTFPCHGCARHIVAAGIGRVVYIEPYAKSLVKTLYSDSISVDESCSEGKVKFEPYIGLAPRRYLEFFRMGTRKDPEGNAIGWEPKTATPRLSGWESWLSIEKENRQAVELRLQMKAKRIVAL